MPSPASTSPPPAGPPRRARTLAGALVGLAGSVAIWVAAPWNNYYISGAFISDDFLPIGAAFLMFLLVAGINPLLGLARPSWALDRSQLATIFAMLLVAGVASGNGALRQLPYALARTPMEVNANGQLARAYESMNLSPWLFPDPIGHNLPTPVGEAFVSQLPRGEAIPWGAWAKPAVAWGALAVSSWAMMIGLALIVLPQWLRNERLAYPLLQVQQSIIDTPGGGRLPPLLRHRGFLIGAGAVFTLHFLYGMSIYFPSRAPAVPLQWDLRRIFTEEPWAFLPVFLTMNRLYFIFIGIAYFMPNRIAFSMWSFVVAWGVYVALKQAYAPPFYPQSIDDQKSGAMIVLAIVILWLGRARWAEVARRLTRWPAGDEERRDLVAGVLFLGGCAGLFLWLFWLAGAPPLWALFFVALAFTICLLIARVVAETGSPFFRINALYPAALVRMAPLAWLSPLVMLLGHVMNMMFIITSRTSLAAHAAQGLAMDRDATPRHQARTALLMMGLMVVGLLVSGAVHLQMNYRHSMSIDGSQAPINNFGLSQLLWGNSDIMAAHEGRVNRMVYNQWGHVGFGAALAAGLMFLCLRSPRWPLHPIGLFLVHSFHGQQVWPNILIGWLLKNLIVRYGGAGLYTRARPFFLGLIAGEVLAVAFWALATVAVALAGRSIQFIQILPT